MVPTSFQNVLQNVEQTQFLALFSSVTDSWPQTYDKGKMVYTLPKCQCRAPNISDRALIIRK